ncbi:MAG: ATP-binding cassette domain-containing protein [Candidatus Magasanikbacteria bacterium]|nr:ATP-binding cassette domain-containing protein [Candidatus Magasanikbacteria bacterium]
MEKKALQNYLYQKRQIIKQVVRPLKLNPIQKNFIKRFILKKRYLIFFTLILSLFTLFIEISSPLWISLYLKKYSYWLEIKNLFFSFLTLLFILILYLIAGFYAIKFEKKIIVFFINDLRRAWYKNFINKHLLSLTEEDRGKIFTKITYHFSLLQIGLANSLFPLVHILFLELGLIIASLIISTSILFIVLLSIAINAMIFFSSYIVSKYYVSRDQTMYSKILLFINKTLAEFSVLKLNKKEKSYLSYFDRLVEVDTFFRVKRELWLKYGNKIIFAVLTIFAGLIYILEIYYPFIKIENSIDWVILAIFISLIIKSFYLSLRIGLFSYPIKLGSVLSIPEKYNRPKIKNKKRFSKIIFKAKKTNINRSGNKFSDLHFEFYSDKRYLIYGKESTGKTNLAKIFCGLHSNSQSQAWVINYDEQRYLYKHWKRIDNNFYYVYPNFNTELCLMEILKAKKIDTGSAMGIENILNEIKDLEPLNFLFRQPNLLYKKNLLNNLSFKEKALIQLAYCIIHKPPVIIIDNLWLDIGSPMINQMIVKIDEVLDKSTLICFSTHDNNLIDYEKKYKLGN